MTSEKADISLTSDSISGDVTNLNELTSLIQGVLQQTQGRFQHMSNLSQQNGQTSGSKDCVDAKETERVQEQISLQTTEERRDSYFLNRLLGSLGRWFSTLHDVSVNGKHSNNAIRCPERLTSPSKKEENSVDYYSFGMFWDMDLESAHSDFLVDIIGYAFSRQACYPSTTKADWHAIGGYQTFTLTNLFIADVFYSQRLPTEVLPLAAYLVAVTVSKCDIARDQLEDLSVAAVRLAAKVESQYTLCEDITSEFESGALDMYERQICRATDFRLSVCTSIFFMRLLQKLVQHHSWQWKFAKFASQLACCQIELATLRPALLAGVVMRLTCLIAGDDSWTSDCYSVIGEDSSDYDFPQSILCRLILSVRLSEEFEESYSRYRHTIDHVLSLRPDWIRSQAAAANRVKILGNHVFE